MSKSDQNLKTPQPGSASRSSDLNIRLRTGFIYAILVIASAMLGNIATLIMVTITAGVTASEFYLMLRSDAKLPNEFLGIIGSAAMPVSIFFFGATGAVMTLTILIFALTIWYIGWTRARIADVAISLFGVIYTGFTMSSIVVLRLAMCGCMTLTGFTGFDTLPPIFSSTNLLAGLFILFIFTGLSLNDGMAYLFGRKFGKHRLAPHVSPKKSWEGFIAGLVISSLWWCILLIFPGVQIELWQCLLFGLLTGLAGVLGDLVESRIKRNSGVKDSGNLMPGHGGLMDRMDSVFLYGLSSAFLLLFFGCIALAV